jgi:hypothetical protein
MMIVIIILAAHDRHGGAALTNGAGPLVVMV